MGSSGVPDRKVAVLGAGKMATEHARAFRNVPGVAVVGIASRTRAKAEALGSELGIDTICDSAAELYEQTRPDLVVVAVNEWAIEEVAHECLQFPWLVLLEKPPGLSVEAAEAIQARARQYGCDVRIGLNRQWLSSTQQVLKGLEAVDGPRFILVQDQQNLQMAMVACRPYDVRAHWMYANSIHLVDYFRFLGRGNISRVEQIHRWEAEHPSVVSAKIHFDSGDEGLYLALWHAPGPWSASVTVPEHRWELRPLEQATHQQLGKPVTSLEVHKWDREFKPGFRLQAEEAVRLLRGETSLLPSIEDGTATMRLIQRIYGV